MNTKMLMTAAIMMLMVITGSFTIVAEEDDAATVTLTVIAQDGGSVSVTYYQNGTQRIGSVLPSGSNDFTCDSGTSVTLTATASTGYSFYYWMRNGTTAESSSNPYTFTISQSRTYFASWNTTNNHSLYMSVDSSFTGCSVEITVGGSTTTVSAGDGQRTTIVPDGSTVTLTAKPGTKYAFSNWSDGATSNPYTFTMTADKTLYASFYWTGTTYHLKLSADGGTIGVSYSYHGNRYTDTVSSSDTYTVDRNTQVTLSATASTGYTFNQWSDGTTSNPYTFTMTTNTTLSADFYRQYSLLLTSHEGGTITVSYTSLGTRSTGTVASGSSETFTCDSGTSVTLTATASTGYSFYYWMRNGTTAESSSNPYTFTISQSRTYFASWTAVENYSLYLTVDGSYTGCSIRITVDGTYLDTVSAGDGQRTTVIPSGSSVSLSAVAGTNFVFSSWSDGTTANPYAFTISENKTLSVVFYEQYILTLASMNGGSVTVSYYDSGVQKTGTVAAEDSAQFPVDSGTSVTLTATASTGYSFFYWRLNGTTPESSANPYTFTMSSAKAYFASWTSTDNCSLYLTVDGSYTGCSIRITVDGTYLDTVSAGDGQRTTVIPSGSSVSLSAVAGTNFVFSSWSDGTTANPYAFTISENKTLSVVFTSTIAGNTYWSNDLYNGSVQVAFKFYPTSNWTHTMTMDLYESVTSGQTVSWQETDYSLVISTSMNSGSGATVSISLKDGTETIGTYSGSFGMWSAFVLTISPAYGSIVFEPISKFDDFTSFTLNGNPQTLMTWETPGATTIHEIKHGDTGSGATHPRFSVVSTWPFLDTFGVVLSDPSLDVGAYYPQYSTIQVNLTSFAVLGQSMTVNGHTWQVTGDGIDIIYVTQEDGTNVISTAGTEGSQTRHFTLSNINITWDGKDTLLNFGSDNFTVNLGAYTAKTFSFAGLWYFTATVSEPYTATQTVISGEWDSMLDIDPAAMVLIFLGIIILAGLFCHIKFKLKWLDISMLVIAAIVAFTLLG